MQSSQAASFPTGPAAAGRSKNIASIVLPVGLLLGGGLLVAHDSQSGIRLVFAIGVFLLLGGLAWRANPMAAAGIVTFLALLGGIRRFLILDFGWAPMDPLVLVSPVLSILCFVSMAVNRQVHRDTPLSKYLYWLLIVMVLQIFNPLQHGLIVGIGGVLFYIAPLIWFYLGKRISSRANVHLLQQTVLWVSVAGALYAFKQLRFGFSEAEMQWMKTGGGYVSLYISADAIRPFSFFTSMQEYALFVCAGVVIAWSQFLRKDARALLALIVLIPALFLTGGRGPIVLTLLACCVMWAIQSPKRSVWFPRLVTALAFGIIGVGWSLNNADSSGFGKGAEGILNHQKQGLLDPSNSTAGKHADLVSGGIMAGIKQPIGYGLGITTSAAGKFGGEGMSSEMDISNLFISLGIVGGVLYALVMYRVFKDCARLWRITRDPHYQVFIGLFVTLFGQWLNGNLYALCFFVWYLIGYIDKQYSALLDYEAKHGTSHSNGHGGQPAPGRLATAPVMAMNSGVMIDPRQSHSLGRGKRRVKFRR